jgi:hypothetical protein
MPKSERELNRIIHQAKIRFGCGMMEDGLFICRTKFELIIYILSYQGEAFINIIRRLLRKV